MSTIEPANDFELNTCDAWSDMIVRIENHMLISENRKLLIRCETNIFNLYRGAAETELKINDDNIWMHGAKVSPTTDQRSSSNSFRENDPDNSPLQAGAVGISSCCFKAYLFLLQFLCMSLTLVTKIQ